MKRRIILLILLATCGNTMAQNPCVNTGNLQIHSNGNLAFFGNFINNGTFTDNAGTAIFTGTTAQTLSGSSTTNFYNLIINNSSSTGIVLNGGAVSVTNTLTLTDGFVYTSSGNLLNLVDNATISGGSSASYIIGPLRKTGNDAFTFPIGKAGYYMPIGITAPNTATDVFTSEYFRADPKGVYGSAKDASLFKVTDNEYWTLFQNTGTTSENVTLEWNGNTSNIGNLGELRVASWNGSQWDNLGNASTTGTTSDGTLLSSTAASSYNAFSLGTTTSNNPLPITLLSFNAILNNKQVDITWVTASEVNNDFFTIEKTTDGSHFEFVARVDGAGNSNQNLYYKSNDLNPLVGISYYRLKQTDFDGNFTYSKLVPINFENLVESKIYPNPFNTSLTILLDEVSYKKKTELRIYNFLGEEVMNTILTKQFTTLETSHLSSGIYFYCLISNNEIMQSGKLFSNQ